MRTKLFYVFLARLYEGLDGGGGGGGEWVQQISSQ